MAYSMLVKLTYDKRLRQSQLGSMYKCHYS